MGNNQLQQHQKTSTLYKFITNISNVKHQSLANQDLLSNTGGGDQLTIILNGEKILPHPPAISFSSLGNNMTINTTSIGDGIVKTVPSDNPPRPRVMPTDIYLILVIATVSLVVIGVIMYALYKAIKVLKLSLYDAREDSLPAPSNQRRRDGQNMSRGALGINNSNARHSASNSSLPRSTTSNGVTPTGTARRGAGIAALPFFQGIRNLDPAQLFTATLRSTTSTISDQPPPYDDELPPPYCEAIKMSIHTREEMCTLRKSQIVKKGSRLKMGQPSSSSSNAQPAIIRPSTSSDEEQQPGGSVQIVITSPRDISPEPESNEDEEEESDNEGINMNESSSVDIVAMTNSTSDGDETDGRTKKEHLKYVSMTVVI